MAGTVQEEAAQVGYPNCTNITSLSSRQLAFDLKIPLSCQSMPYNGAVAKRRA